MKLVESMRNRGRGIYATCWRTVQIGLIVLAGAAVYSNTLHVPFILDDPKIRLIGKIGPLEHLFHGTARRVTDISFSLNYRLHDLQVTGYHLVNLSIHILAAVTLYLLAATALAALRQSIPCHAPGTTGSDFLDRFIPLAAALLFAVHPVQTQAVTYIIQRYTSLATLFYLLSTLFFIKARLAFERDGQLRTALLPAAASLAAGFLALGSKQIAATLPLMMIFLEISLFRGRLLNRRFSIACGSLFMLAVVAVLVQWHNETLDTFLGTIHHATAEDTQTSRTTYFLTQTRVVATYIRLLCLPVAQSLVHDSSLYTTLFSLPVAASLALHASIITAAVVLWRSSGQRLKSGPCQQGMLQRMAALGIVWFYCAMTMESSFFPIRDVIFEHRIYLPSAGFFLAVASAAALVILGRRFSNRTAWWMLAAACLVLGGMTLARNQVWNDPLALYQDSARKAPNNVLALGILANEYLSRNLPEKALPLFVRTVEIKPDLDTDRKVYLGKALQYLNVDTSLFTTGEELASYGKGETSREDQIRMEYIMRNNLALAYEYLGEPAKARESYRAALRVNPDYELAWYNLGLLSIHQGDQAQTAASLEQLKRLKPYLADHLAAAAAK